LRSHIVRTEITAAKQNRAEHGSGPIEAVHGREPASPALRALDIAG
jgi:hypothetical protein